MQITSKGQVTIPKEFRDALGLLPYTEVEFVRVGDELRVKKAEGKMSRGQRIVEQLAGKGDIRLTTDEIMKLTRGD